MPTPPLLRRLAGLDWNLARWTGTVLQILGKALTRLWGRDVMLYTGGVSFFVMLAIFPGLAIVVGLYGLLADPAQAAGQAELLAGLMPPGARDLFVSELTRLVHAPGGTLTAQSGVALVIGAYAAHRGFKALLAAVLMMGALSAIFFGLRLIHFTFGLRPLAGVLWLYSEWTWVSAGLTLGMTLIYRFAMSRDRVPWRGAAAGGAAAALLCLAASWACAIYVEQIAELGATYGSLAAFVVFLIWLSWNVNAVFFGGALATEIEFALARSRREERQRSE